MRKYPYVIVLFLSILVSSVSAQEDLIPLKAAIHVSSSVSDGQYSLTQIAQTAKDVGISIVVFTDRDLMRWEYGLWPLSNVIKKIVENNSIFTYGIKHYLKEIETLQNKFPEMILIPGVESAPFYYWQGSPFKSAFILGRRLLYSERKPQDIRSQWRERLHLKRKHLWSSLEFERMRMYNWHIHILGIGLENYQDYKNLPVIGNSYGLKDRFNVFMLWPLLTLIWGLWRCKVSLYWYTDHTGRHLGVYSKKWIIMNTAVVLVSTVFLINNWPFYGVKFDQYHGDLKNSPYQNYIDYVNKIGGVTFWAHPEAENIQKIGDIGFVTQAHTHLLLDTKNYTGFNIFPEGYKEIGKIGGIWDKILYEYCRGLRQKPIWAIGGLAFDQGNLPGSMKNLQTVTLVTEMSKNAVMDAFWKGRMYVVSGENSLDFSLDEFFVSDEVGKAKGNTGETVTIKGTPTIYLKGKFLSEQREVEVRIIREGGIVKTYKTETPFSIVYYGEDVSRKNSYYRIEIQGKGLRLITNPIFVAYSYE